MVSVEYVVECPLPETFAEKALEMHAEGVHFHDAPGWKFTRGYSHMDVFHFEDGSAIIQRYVDGQPFGTPEIRNRGERSV